MFSDVIAPLRSGHRSCRESAIDSLAALDRISHLRAVAWRDDELVLARAAALDERFASTGPVGPLHGVPFTVKDWIDVDGFPCAAGNPASAGRRPARDATVVARLHAAGAIVIAKMNVGASSELHGATEHPFASGRSPGYSSAGDAAAVAAGVVPLGIGSDSGGSLRFPAHCCGLATLRSTTGRVPGTGHFPRIGPLEDGRSVIGPLCRSVADVAAVMPVLAGPDGRDPICPPVPWPHPVGSVAGMRVAVHGLDDAVAAPEIRSLVSAGAARLEAAGAQVTAVDVLDVDESLDITLRYWGRSQLAAGEVERLLRDWDRVRVRAMRLLDRFDAVICAGAPHVAPMIGRQSNDDWRYLLAPSLWGWPAAVARAGTVPVDGLDLPVGVQVVAGPWREDVALAVAAAVEVV